MDLRIVLILLFGLVHGSLSEPQKELNSVKEKGKADPTKAKILKQINKVNDDGSYTFGYEADDGSFKVETRSKDGVVKGKYGFLDSTGKLKTVEYTAGEKSNNSNDENDETKEDIDSKEKDQALASATTNTKTLTSKGGEDEERYNNNNSQDFNSYGSQESGPIDRQDDGQSQYLRQVSRAEQPKYNPTTQLSGGRFNNPEEQQYQSAGPTSQFGGQQQYIGGGPQQQYIGGSPQQFAGGPQQQFSGNPQGFSPGQLQQFVGSLPSQLAGSQRVFSGPEEYSGGQQVSGFDREIQQQQPRFSGSPQQFSEAQQQYQFPQQQYVGSPQNQYFGPQQQFLGQQQGQFTPQQFSGSQLGEPKPTQQLGGIGRPDLQNFVDSSQYSGARQLAGPNRASSAGANELGFDRRPASLGSSGSTQEYIPTVDLEGFSEDTDQDGYVDPFPGSKNAGGDVKTAQAAEKTAAVKTPDGEKVSLNQGQYNPQVLGPQHAQQFPQGQIQGGRPFEVSPYNEQQLQQIYQQQGLGGQSQFPGSPQLGFQSQSQFQGQPHISGQSPYQGQGIPPSQSPYQGQGIVQSQLPYQGQAQLQGQPQFQVPQQQNIQDAGQFQTRPQVQGQPDFQSGQQFQGRPDFQGQPQFNPQQQQFSPELQGGGIPQQFLGGGAGIPSQGGPYIGGGFPPQFGIQSGPIPPQYLQGGPGQQFVPQQSPSPYAGGIQSAGFPFDYSPYNAIGQGGFQGSPNYPQVPQQPSGRGVPAPQVSGAKPESGEDKKA